MICYSRSARFVSRRLKKLYFHQLFSSSVNGPKHAKIEQSRERFNEIKIQMLSPGLYQQIFGDGPSCAVAENIMKNVVSHLKMHDVWGTDTNTIPDVEFLLPKLRGSTIDQHFQNIGDEMSSDYKKLAFSLTNSILPPMPKEWKFASGWTKYEENGTVTSVDYPIEPALVFDVEVCVQEGNYPTLAAAVSEKCWYLWCSKRLTESSYTWSKRIALSDLIPLETSTKELKPVDGWTKRLIVGHNVAFDRTFVKEQYFLDPTECCFLDTMSLHVCVSGLTGLQRAMSVAGKKEATQQNLEFPDTLPFAWADMSSLNNLADVYNLYCEGILEKTQRDVFVTGSMNDIKGQFQELATYCANDVIATYKVLKKVMPMFFERFPHPVTFAGILEMATVYLPINQNWDRYLNEAQNTYDDLQKELKLSLIHLANDACSFQHDDMYKNDPWLWNLDWKVQEMKFRKTAPVSSKKKQKKSNKDDKSTEIVEEMDNDCEVPVEIENNKTECDDPTMKQIYDSASSLRKIRPFMAGYPAWYRELCDKSNMGKKDWEPGPILISTQMRCVPKLMRLTWDNYVIHYDAKHGWGYLVSDSMKSNIEDQNFPLRSLTALHQEMEKNSVEPTTFDFDAFWALINEPREDRDEEHKLWQSILKKGNKPLTFYEKVESNAEHYGIGPYDIGISGCLFYRLPHKDGPTKRVGNPLSKDFLPKVEDNTLKSWGKGRAERALILSKMLSYWKNANKRITSQMVVWLKNEELSFTIQKAMENNEEMNVFGAILPRLIPAGTVTRRAVEPTWLTASNAYVDRVGSELKSMVQSPPGYNIVGADVDSQELWIAAILGDSHFAKIHGCTALGWMTLQGKKSAETDMHSRTAKSVGISRHQAKILNYARIYGAGKPFAQRLLMQFNHRLSPNEAKMRVKKIYAETKGNRKFVAEKQDDEAIFNVGFSGKKQWFGGSESHLFNKLEKIVESPKPKTPVLDCRISRALEPNAVDTNFMTSRVNWVVQSSAVDYLHLIIISMKWLMKHYEINGRLSICIHDEVRYLVKREDRYRAALALQITNLWTRSIFAYKLGMKDLPQSVAFFSSVDIDTALRKEVDMDSVTPSNPHGLNKGYGIPRGEALDIHQILDKTNGGILEPELTKKS